MLTIEEQAKVADLFYDNYREVERAYLDKVASQLKEIGTLNASNIKRVEQLAILNGNVDDITKQLAKATNVSTKEMEEQLTAIATELYGDASKYYTAAGVVQVGIAENVSIQRLISSVADLTGGTMANLSQSTIITQGYTKAVDNAVIAVTSGVSDFNSSMRSTIRGLASSGIQTQTATYASGAVRRLDSAVRMNMMDAMHSVNLGVAQIVGQEFGADGVEITSHSNPAPDHVSIDGAVMTNKQYETFQKSAERPIGQLNCYHFAIPILLDIHKAKMTDAERAKKQASEAQPIAYDGVEKTAYEWSQTQRQLETSMRYQRDIERMAGITGDTILAETAKNQRKIIEAKYKSMSKAVGLNTEMRRTY